MASTGWKELSREVEPVSPCDDCDDPMPESMEADLMEIAGPDGLPSEEELDAALAAVAAEDGAEALELDLARLGQGLSVEEELAFAALETGEMPTLESLLVLVQRYEGLKITFSY